MEFHERITKIRIEIDAIANEMVDHMECATMKDVVDFVSLQDTAKLYTNMLYKNMFKAGMPAKLEDC